jgi:hypothetical protein
VGNLPVISSSRGEIQVFPNLKITEKKFFRQEISSGMGSFFIPVLGSLSFSLGRGSQRCTRAETGPLSIP